MDDEKKLLRDLKDTILEFVTNLQSLFTDPKDMTDLMKIQIYFQSMDSHKLMNYAIQFILPHRQAIKDKDVKYVFDPNKRVLDGFPEDKLNYIKNLILTPEDKGGLSPEELDAVWQYFEVILALCDKHNKKYCLLTSGSKNLVLTLK